MVEKEKIIEVLKQCFDPEIPVDLWSLGLIYDINITETENNNTNESDEKEESDENEDSDEINEEEYTKNVTSILIHGTEYYIDDDNKLYDPDTTELIGKYNRDNDSVIN